MKLLKHCLRYDLLTQADLYYLSNLLEHDNINDNDIIWHVMLHLADSKSVSQDDLKAISELYTMHMLESLYRPSTRESEVLFSIMSFPFVRPKVESIKERLKVCTFSDKIQKHIKYPIVVNKILITDVFDLIDALSASEKDILDILAVIGYFALKSGIFTYIFAGYELVTSDITAKSILENIEVYFSNNDINKGYTSVEQRQIHSELLFNAKTLNSNILLANMELAKRIYIIMKG